MASSATSTTTEHYRWSVGTKPILWSPPGGSCCLRRVIAATEDAFGLTIEPRGQVVDIGRFTVAHELAVKENRYFAGLLGFCWLEARSHGYIRVCGTASPGMLRHYRRLGFIVTELAPPHVYYGEERFPCWYDVIGSAQVLLKMWGSGN